ncbi:MAG TPA: response regulator transcription factor [Acidimicrobiales bacterium]|nr:response regulator transcription factor [Acidimicrobiales bacterium]
MLTVLVAEPDRLFRLAVAAAVGAEADVDAVLTAGDSDEALAHLEKGTVDVALVAAWLEPAGGVELCAAVKSAGLCTRVLILGHDADQGVLRASVEAGGDGFLTRSCALAEVVSAIRRAHAGEACIPPGMLGLLLRGLIDRRREEDAVVARFTRLSRREQEVLAMVVDGYDHQDIAATLFLSPHTARTHIQNVLEKLGVHSRLEAAALVSEHKLVERFFHGGEAERTA